MSRNKVNILLVLGDTEEKAHESLSGKLQRVDWLRTET